MEGVGVWGVGGMACGRVRDAVGLGDRSIFFFKQKTAYGISECDWSSDVCSSD
eukprot:COSAG06_NODE_59831_length_273_cov_0.557471_1_plen_52_part_10